MDRSVSQGQFDKTTKLLEQKIRETSDSLVKSIQATSESYIEKLKETQNFLQNQTLGLHQGIEASLKEALKAVNQSLKEAKAYTDDNKYSDEDIREIINKFATSYNNFVANTLRFNDVFDTDGQFTGKINPLSVETAALMVGTRSQQLSLTGVEFRVLPYDSTNGNGTLQVISSKNSGKNAPEKTNDVYDIAGFMFHYGFGTDTDPKVFAIKENEITLSSTDAYYIYAKLNAGSDTYKETKVTESTYKSMLRSLYTKNEDVYTQVTSSYNSGTTYYIKESNSVANTATTTDNATGSDSIATIEVSTQQKTLNSESGYLIIKLGYISAPLETSISGRCQRKVDMTYGSTTIDGRLITTGKIEGNGCSFDLDNGEIKGKIKFQADTNGSYGNIEDIISSRSSVKDAIKESKTLYYASDSTSAPDKPTNSVTTNNNSLYNQWNQSMPTYNENYPYLYICTENQTNGNTYSWTSVQQTSYVAAIANLSSLEDAVKQRIDNIDSDSVFSIAEKQVFRLQFQDIIGINIATNGTIPDIFTLKNDQSTYANGSFIQHYTKISSTATNTLSALESAYTALYSELKTYQLYTNTDYASFDRNTLQSLLSSYYKAETDIDFYAENVGALVGTCTTGAAEMAKKVDCLQIPTSMLCDMLSDKDMRMKVQFTRGNSANTATFYFRNDGGATSTGFIPTGVTNQVCYFYFNGETTYNKCFWPAGIEIELKYRTKSTTNVTYECSDVPKLLQAIALAKSIEGTTDITGGLILTRTILCKNEDDEVASGMTGVRTGDISFFAGGTYEEAISKKSAMYITRNGEAKFGRFFIDPIQNQFSMIDSTGVPRLLFHGISLKSHSINKIYNPENSSNRNIFSKLSEISSTIITETQQITSIVNLQNANGDHSNGYNMEMNIKATIEVVPDGKANAGTAYVDLQYYDGSDWQSCGNIIAQCNSADTRSLAINTQVKYSSGSTSQVGLRVVYSKDADIGGVYFTVSEVSWCYYADASTRMMQIAPNGFEFYYNTLNYFLVKFENTALTTTIKGNTDIPGVLWAGMIAAVGTATTTTTKSNAGRSVAGSVSDISLYTLTLTGFTSSPTPIATVEFPSGDTNNGWSANIVSVSQTQIKIRIRKNNTNTAAPFHLVLFGTN